MSPLQCLRGENFGWKERDARQERFQLFVGSTIHLVSQPWFIMAVMILIFLVLNLIKRIQSKRRRRRKNIKMVGVGLIETGPSRIGVEQGVGSDGSGQVGSSALDISMGSLVSQRRNMTDRV